MPKRRKVDCGACGRVFDGEEELALHREYEHQQEEAAAVPCPQCGAALDGDEALALHLSFGHAESPKRGAEVPEVAQEETTFVLLGKARSGGGAWDGVVWAGGEDTRLFFGRESWGSCGYRNLQSMLAAAGARVPSLLGAQQLVCAAWRAGFDCRSARQLGGDALIGSRKWVGACECLCALRMHNRRAFVYEFERVPQRPFDAGPLRAFAREWFSGAPGVSPLQVQWKGHSVLAVGLAATREALVVWDPNAARLLLRPWAHFGEKGTLHVVALLPGVEEHLGAARDMGYMARHARI